MNYSFLLIFFTIINVGCNVIDDLPNLIEKQFFAGEEFGEFAESPILPNKITTPEDLKRSLDKFIEDNEEARIKREREESFQELIRQLDLNRR